ncbi:hypothetical protein Hmuk_3359 (plasmid) [Halomicrobium mukohataei DSM 12286]|uniref:Uncharacterized protein n=1 Tax=Halomicrobium mukohataei (strain ATCC 700874 / DSM 12286 / JCM 9738 / NCIMB 13541) TaxID=485914 RepID=C7P550_HALMD|nr:hypothetical protein Hmuk_3359 [Halomicrobium mukohataei DSM 12286]
MTNWYAKKIRHLTSVSDQSLMKKGYRSKLIEISLNQIYILPIKEALQ